MVIIYFQVGGSHHGSELVQFEIDYDELQEGTSLQLVGLELVEYTTISNYYVPLHFSFTI